MAGAMGSLALGFSDSLTSEGIELIHEKSLEIVSDIGVVVKHEQALDLLREHGAQVDRESQLVRIPRSLVHESIESTPATFSIHGRHKDQTVTVGEGEPFRTPVFGPTNVRTFDSGERESTIGDYEMFMQLVQQEPSISSPGYNVCEPNDVPHEVKHIEMLHRSLRMTDKPVLASTYGEERARSSLEMVGIAFGDRQLRDPYVMGLVNTVPPRQWDTKMTAGLMEFAKEEQPVIITPGVMAGASGPATMAGSVALSNAESLVGIVIAQLVSPGTPLVYSLSGNPIDMRYGTFATGSPEGRVISHLANQMGRRYEMPVRGLGSMTDAKSINSQSGSESMLSLFVSTIAGSDVIIHAAGGLNSYSTASPEKFVLDAERIRILDHLNSRFELTDEAFAIDLIEEVEPGGHFLNEQHTLSHVNTDHFFPEIFERRSADTWMDAGEPDTFKSAREHVDKVLEEYERPVMDPDIERELESFVTTRNESANDD